MKILIIGFLAFFGWSALSTYIYVCKIKGLCHDPETIEIVSVNPEDVITGDTLSKPLVKEQAVIPENLIIYFAFGNSELNPDAELDQYFDESTAYLDQHSQSMLVITGHTDAIGSNEDNQALGYRRAQSVQHYFESNGMPANKIIIESMGEKEPADDNMSPSGRANNRRAEITIKK